VIDRGTI
jgi:hypothetical protein